jgi:hypothetical protein
MSIPKKGKNGLNAITVGVPSYIYNFFLIINVYEKKKAQRSAIIIHRELCRLPSC